MTRQEKVAWWRFRLGQMTVLIVGVIYAALSVHLRPLPVFDDIGFVLTGHDAMIVAAMVCVLAAAFPTSSPIRAASGAAVVGAAAWRGIASLMSLGAGPALVWALVVVLLLTTWTYVLPSPVPPPDGRSRRA